VGPAGIKKESAAAMTVLSTSALDIAQGREVYFAALSDRTALRMSFPTEIAALSS
jgi:hypothetical protein